MGYTPISTPRGSVVFCDEIRQEITNKLIYIGVYPAELRMGANLPALLTPLSLAVSYMERPNESTEPVTIRVQSSWSEEPVLSYEWPVAAFREAPDWSHEQDFAIVGTALLQCPPIVVPSAGSLTVWADRGKCSFRIGRLVIDGPEPAKVES